MANVEPKLPSELLSQEEEVTDLVTQAKTFKIASLQDVEVGAEMIRGMKALQKEIEDHHGPIKKAAHAAWKVACAAETKLTSPIKASITEVRRQLTSFETARQREELEAKRKAEAEAAKLAERLNVPKEMVPVEQPKEAKVEGVSYTTKFEWEFTGELSAVNPVFLVIDARGVNAIVKARGKDAEKIVGGIKVTERKIPRVSK